MSLERNTWQATRRWQHWLGTASLATLLALIGWSQGQGCLPEAEPNDTPAEATPFAGFGCVIAASGGGGQDLFVWTVGEQELRNRQVVFELTGVPGQLTNAVLLRLAFAENGVDVTAREDLLAFGTSNGATVSSGPHLLAAGTYYLGIATSGGEESYVLTARLVDPAVPTRVDREPNDSGAEAAEQQGAFALSGSLQGSVDYHRWTLSEEGAEQLWRVSAQAMPGEPLTLKLYRSSGELVLNGAAEEQTLTWHDLALEPGTYTLVVGPASERLAPYLLQADSQGTITDGRETEPNNQPREANHLDLDLGVSGTLGTSERDVFRFRTTPENAGSYALSVDIDADARLCLFAADDIELTCQQGSPLGLASLGLPAGEYLLVLDGSSRDAPYTLGFSPTAPPEGEEEREPNGTLATATELGESLAARGTLSARESDFYRFALGGGPELYRVQVLGDGVELLRYYDGGGTLQQEVRTSGQRRLRLDNLVLLPGEHTFEVRGTNGDYLLKAISLGPAPVEGGAQAASDGPPPADAAADAEEGDIAVLYPRPAGVLELEPNDDESRARLLRAGETYVGTLADPADVDSYRLSLQNDGYVRLEAVPGLEGQIYFDVGAGLRTETLGVGEPTVFERWLLAGDYLVTLRPRVPSDAYYQLRLELLDPFALPADFEPNDSARQARPLPDELAVAGVVGQYNDRDWYLLPSFDTEVQLTVEVLAGSVTDLRVYDRQGDEPLAYPERDIEKQTFAFTLPAGTETALRVSGQGGYRLGFDFQGALEPRTRTLEVTASLELEADRVAAYWHEGQRLEATLRLTNDTTEEQRVTLRAHTSDVAVQPTDLPEQVTLAPRSSLDLPFSVRIEPDARDDQPVVLTVAAASEAGLISASAGLQPICEAPAVAGSPYWPLPEALLGRVDVALTAFGAQVVETPDLHHRDQDLFDGRVSPAAGPTHEPGQSVIVDLAGDEPVTLLGTLLHPLANAPVANQLKDFEIALSLDGSRFDTVFRGSLDAVRREQAFLFPEPTPARYAQLRFLSQQDEEAYGQIRLGEWKLLAEEGPQSALNLADPRLGGYVVWSDPLLATENSPVLTDPAAGGDAARPRLHLPAEVRTIEWVVGFHHNRAAQLQRLEWVDHERSTPEGRLRQVEVLGSDSPVGPWIPLASWTLEREPASDEATIPPVRPLELEHPVWARFVLFRATGLEPRTTYDLPETIRIFERPTDEDYRSILGEWGFYAQPAILELLQPPGSESTTEPVDSNDTRETAEPLEDMASGRVLLGSDVDWYRITVPEGHNRLDLRFEGEPTIGYHFELQDASGVPVEAVVSAGPDAVDLTASVLPGSYYLKLEEPPRSIVFSWDTSGSVGPYQAAIYGALARFATQIEAGREEVALLPFDDPRPRFLRADWTGQAADVMAALNGFDRSANSSSAEAGLLEATRALSGRTGTRAVLFITDAESGSYRATSELWRAMAGTRPQVFTFEISSSGSDSSQDLMQSWTTVNHGVYSQPGGAGDFDIGFARATCLLRRPKAYTVRAGTSFVELEPGTLRVVSAPAADAPTGAAGATAAAAVEVILDASGSMYKTLGGRFRYEIAKDVLGAIVASQLPEGTPFALRVFGNREAESCRTDLELPLAPLEAGTVEAVLAAIEPQPFAGTPIAASLRQVAGDLAGTNGPKTVILITDGEESCDGDVEAEIEALRAQDIEVVLNIIGFDFDADDRDAARAAFRRWAELGGGQYFDAASAEELELSLARSLSLGYEVIDEAGELVARGTVDGEALELPAGRYTVRVLAEPPLLFEGVRLAGGASVELILRPQP